MIDFKTAGDVLDEIEKIQKTISGSCAVLNRLKNDDEADVIENAVCLLANYRETLRGLQLKK